MYRPARAFCYDPVAKFTHLCNAQLMMQGEILASWLAILNLKNMFCVFFHINVFLIVEFTTVHDDNDFHLMLNHPNWALKLVELNQLQVS